MFVAKHLSTSLVSSALGTEYCSQSERFSAWPFFWPLVNIQWLRICPKFWMWLVLKVTGSLKATVHDAHFGSLLWKNDGTQPDVVRNFSSTKGALLVEIWWLWKLFEYIELTVLETSLTCFELCNMVCYAAGSNHKGHKRSDIAGDWS